MLQVHASSSSTQGPDQTGHNSRLSWTAAGATSSSRRPPKAGPGLSLKQQASSPRWGARRGIGSSLISPASAFRQGNGAVSALPRRSVQARPSSQLGLPVRHRRALSEDEPESHYASDEPGRLNRAQSVMPPKHQTSDLDAPFIELTDLELIDSKAGDRPLDGYPSHRLAESLPPWTAAVQEARQTYVQEQPEEVQDEYGAWSDAGQQEQTEDPKQRLLP